WLTTRYQLIIRSEENFAERTSLGFTYSKVILFSVIMFTLLFGMSMFMSKTILARWFDPKHEQLLMSKQLDALHQAVDSLSTAVENKDLFIRSVTRVLSGDTTAGGLDATIDTENPPFTRPTNLNATPNDSAFRKDF